jgi:predicted flap endonuclease-1-like 5' DNA nuclease
VSIILALVFAVVGFAVGYAVARARRVGAARPAAVPITQPPAALAEVAVPREHAGPSAPPAPPAMPSAPPAPLTDDHTIAERARIIRSYEAEAALLGRAQAGRDATIAQLTDFAGERRRLFDDLAAAHAETARYRQLVIDLENNAAPQFFGVDAPDDLKLIVGIGPVLERMLQMMGVATYRQIARWSERDIDEFDAKLHEFPGRIRRDAWVTQARALHQSKYGEALPLRGRG